MKATTAAALTWQAAAAAAGIAWALLLQQVLWWDAGLWLALGVGPVIGLAVGWLILPYRTMRDWVGTALLALVGLYVTAILFGTAIGLRDISQGAAHTALETIWLPLVDGLVICWGLTLSGLVIVFWPLAIATHLVIWRLQRRLAA